MVRKVGMHGRDRIFRHMATHTVVFCNLADANRMGSVFLSAARWRMASHAHFVVEGSILHSGFVGVVARYAGESRIAISPAATLL
jgi:hypothetical protein